jgi:stage II sporulation protein E
MRQSAKQYAGEAAQGFYEMYLAMLTGAQRGRFAADEDIHAIFDKAADRVCRSCAICGQCWQRDYIATLSALNDVSAPMLKRGRAEAGDFPRHFSDRCIRFPELLRSVNEALFTLRERQEYRKKCEENRSLVARQYAGVTGILRQVSAGLSQECVTQPARERQVRRYAAAFGKVDSVAVFRDGGHRLRVELAGPGIDAILREGEGFAAGLSALLSIGLSAPEKRSDELGVRLVMREKAPFRAVVGVAQRQKEGEKISGDTGRYFLTEEGVACLLLCDGMGTGEAAAHDSRMMLGLMERFLRAGVQPGDAIRTVAPAFRLQNDGRRFVTMDVLTLDLFSGRAESIKCGAAPSYLRTAGGLTRLMNAALPVGLSEEDGAGDAVPLRLAHGDLFLMLSDGVTDGTDDRWVLDILQKNPHAGPKEIAAQLVAGASLRGAADDMTAMVLRLEHCPANRAKAAKAPEESEKPV